MESLDMFTGMEMITEWALIIFAIVISFLDDLCAICLIVAVLQIRMF